MDIKTKIAFTLVCANAKVTYHLLSFISYTYYFSVKAEFKISVIQTLEREHHFYHEFSWA